MCKKLFVGISKLSFLILLLACSGKKEGNENPEGTQQEHRIASGDDWKEMDDFHMIMAESFHPYKDSADLEPAKQNVAALVASAEKWANAPLPEKFKDDDEIKFKLAQLKTDAITFSEVVKTGDDKAMGESLTKLHNLFHAIQEAWYGEEEGHEH